MKHIVIIDGQTTFKNMTKDKHVFKNISNFIKNNVMPVTLVFDKTILKNNTISIDEKRADFLDEYHLDDINWFYNDLFEKDIAFELIESLIDHNEIIMKGKEYGYLRDAIDCSPNSAYLIGKAAQFCQANFCGFTESQIKELMDDAPFFRNLTHYIMKKEAFTLNAMCDVLMYCAFDYYTANEKYEHIDIKDEIHLMGGAALECYLEEYTTLRLLGYKNIMINPNYIYGGNPELFQKLIDKQEKEFQNVLTDTMKQPFVTQTHDEVWEQKYD